MQPESWWFWPGDGSAEHFWNFRIYLDLIVLKRQYAGYERPGYQNCTPFDSIRRFRPVRKSFYSHLPIPQNSLILPCSPFS